MSSRIWEISAGSRPRVSRTGSGFEFDEEKGSAEDSSKENKSPRLSGHWQVLCCSDSQPSTIDAMLYIREQNEMMSALSHLGSAYHLLYSSPRTQRETLPCGWLSWLGWPRLEWVVTGAHFQAFIQPPIKDQGITWQRTTKSIATWLRKELMN